MAKIPMLGVRLFDPDESRYKLTSRFTAHLVRLRQATVEAAKSLSLKELDELVKKLPDHEVDRIDRRVGLILAARAKLPGASHLKTDDRNALRALADGAELTHTAHTAGLQGPELCQSLCPYWVRQSASVGCGRPDWIQTLPRHMLPSGSAAIHRKVG